MMTRGTKVTARSSLREVALLLPGMTLNGSIFPTLPIDTLAIDFTTLSELVQSRMNGYVQLLRDALTDTGFWEYDRRFVLAHSFGGMLALQWLATHTSDRQRINGLVLAGTTAGPMLESARLRVLALGSKELRVPVSPLLAFWDLPLVTRAYKLLMTASLSPRRVDFQTLRFKSDLAVDLAGWRNTHWQAMRSYRAAMRGFDVSEKLGQVDVPAIVLHGPRDSFFTVDVARALADGLPKGELRVIDGAAHLVPLTHGAEVVKALDDLRSR